MSLNSLILGKFTRGKSAGTDAKLLPVHFQILSIFYLNFVLTLLVIMFEGGTFLFMQLPVDRFLTVVCLFGSILSLILLKKGYYEAAGTIVLIYVSGGLFYNVYIEPSPGWYFWDLVLYKSVVFRGNIEMDHSSECFGELDRDKSACERGDGDFSGSFD